MMVHEVDLAIEVLERTPRTLSAMLCGLGEMWVLRNYGEGTFSPFDVVGHLIHADETNWIARIRHILQRGESEPFPAFDRYAMYEANEGKSMDELLRAFGAVRMVKLCELEALNLRAEDLTHRGLHPELGSVTLGQLLSTWVVHDLHHTAQIAKAMAHQYREAVGPWRAYLSILPQE